MKTLENSPQYKAGIIGAGIGGLATASRLARKGYSVDLYETAPTLGGKVAELHQQGYRFDMGPSLFTQPQLLEALFQDCGKDPTAYFDYHKLDSICRYFFPDGKVLTAWSDPEQLAAEFEEKLGEPAQNVRRFLKRSARIYELTADLFLERSMHKASTFLRPKAFKTLLNIWQIDAFRTMQQANSKFFKDPRSIQFFNRYATYNGSDPFKAPATLNVIAHLEHNIGAYFLKGGMRSLSKALEQLARDMGVQVHTRSRVEKIVVENKQVSGVELEGGDFRQHGTVVSNMDVVPTYRQLLRDQPHPEKTLTQPRSSSALIFYWGMRGQWPDLDLHNIFFSKDYAQEFDHLFNRKTLGGDPTVYLYISSKADQSDAPEGCENWFTMINAPHDNGQDWQQLREIARKAILTKLQAHLGPLEEKIETEAVLDPPSIASKTQSHLGALYGNSSNNRFAAFMRHPNFSRKLKGLYFCGGSVHPGGGIPLCLLSAKIVDDLTK